MKKMRNSNAESDMERDEFELAEYENSYDE